MMSARFAAILFFVLAALMARAQTTSADGCTRDRWRQTRHPLPSDPQSLRTRSADYRKARTMAIEFSVSFERTARAAGKDYGPGDSNRQTGTAGMTPAHPSFASS